MEDLTREKLLLTIEGQSYTIPNSHWFFYTGRLDTAPSWFIDAIDNGEAIKLPTGVVHFRNIGNGWPSVQPNSLVFMRKNFKNDLVIESISAHEEAS